MIDIFINNTFKIIKNLLLLKIRVGVPFLLSLDSVCDCIIVRQLCLNIRGLIEEDTHLVGRHHFEETRKQKPRSDSMGIPDVYKAVGRMTWIFWKDHSSPYWSPKILHNNDNDWWNHSGKTSRPVRTLSIQLCNSKTSLTSGYCKILPNSGSIKGILY